MGLPHPMSLLLNFCYTTDAFGLLYTCYCTLRISPYIQSLRAGLSKGNEHVNFHLIRTCNQLQLRLQLSSTTSSMETPALPAVHRRPRTRVQKRDAKNELADSDDYFSMSSI